MSPNDRLISRLNRSIATATNPSLPRAARHRAARAAAAHAESLGLIDRPACCQLCNRSAAVAGRLERHHEDHFRPIEVSFLCPNCHKFADQFSSLPKAS